MAEEEVEAVAEEEAEEEAGANADPNDQVTFGDVHGVSWRAAEAFAVSKGLTVVDLDGAKTGEELAGDGQYPGGALGKYCGAEVLERSGFARAEFDAFTTAHTATAAATRAHARAQQEDGPVAELERAQQALVSSAGSTSRHVTLLQVRKQELYDDAVALFETSLSGGKKMTGSQRDILWNEAEQTAQEQLLLSEPEPAEGLRGRRRNRSRKVRVGDTWFDLG